MIWLTFTVRIEPRQLTNVGFEFLKRTTFGEYVHFLCLVYKLIENSNAMLLLNDIYNVPV